MFKVVAAASAQPGSAQLLHLVAQASVFPDHPPDFSLLFGAQVQLPTFLGQPAKIPLGVKGGGAKVVKGGGHNAAMQAPVAGSVRVPAAAPQQRVQGTGLGVCGLGLAPAQLRNQPADPGGGQVLGVSKGTQFSSPGKLQQPAMGPVRPRKESPTAAHFQTAVALLDFAAINPVHFRSQHLGIHGHPGFQGPLLQPDGGPALGPKQPPFSHVPTTAGAPPATGGRPISVQLPPPLALGQLQPVSAQLLQQLQPQKTGRRPFGPQQRAKVSPKAAPVVQRGQVTLLLGSQGALAPLQLMFQQPPQMVAAAGIFQGLASTATASLPLAQVFGRHHHSIKVL